MDGAFAEGSARPLVTAAAPVIAMRDSVASPLEFSVVNEPAAGVTPPITLLSSVMPVIVPPVKAMLFAVVVISVPEVGSVMLVRAVTVSVIPNAPEVVKAPAVLTLPPNVMVLPVFAIPVPPYCPAITEPCHTPVPIVPMEVSEERVVTELVMRVPEVGSVTFVGAVVVSVRELAPEVMNAAVVVSAPAVEILPPSVIVSPELLTPVPPCAPVTAAALVSTVALALGKVNVFALAVGPEGTKKLLVRVVPPVPLKAASSPFVLVIAEDTLPPLPAGEAHVPSARRKLEVPPPDAGVAPDKLLVKEFISAVSWTFV